MKIRHVLFLTLLTASGIALQLRAQVVADVFRKGYELKGRVIRPAGVRVHRE